MADNTCAWLYSKHLLPDVHRLAELLLLPERIGGDEGLDHKLLQRGAGGTVGMGFRVNFLLFCLPLFLLGFLVLYHVRRTAAVGSCNRRSVRTFCPLFFCCVLGVLVVIRNWFWNFF